MLGLSRDTYTQNVNCEACGGGGGDLGFPAWGHMCLSWQELGGEGLEHWPTPSDHTILCCLST